MPDQPADAARGMYKPFDAAFAMARTVALFSTVGRLYSQEGQLGANASVLLTHLADAGAQNLNLGRLLEGHVNAVQLIRLYGNAAQLLRLDRVLENDEILGVWGADGARGTRIDVERARLNGEKRYASGLGLVAEAVVPIAEAAGELQLVLVDASDPARQHPSAWAMSGMMESASGVFSIEDMAYDETMRLGAPGDYKREPFFEGGIWRCAAVHLGAVETIVSLMARHLDETGHIDHPLQCERLACAILEARTARLWVEDASRRIEAVRDHAAIDTAVALASYARLQVERSALAVMELARRSVGLTSFGRGHPLDAVVADLSVYLRQANPDALLLHKCRTLAAGYLS